MKSFSFVSFLVLLIILPIAICDEKVAEEPIQEPKLSQESEAKSTTNDAQSTGSEEAKSEPPTDSAENSSEEDTKYAMGSLCNYCTYCKVYIYTHH